MRKYLSMINEYQLIRRKISNKNKSFEQIAHKRSTWTHSLFRVKYFEIQLRLTRISFHYFIIFFCSIYILWLHNAEEATCYGDLLKLCEFLVDMCHFCVGYFTQTILHPLNYIGMTSNSKIRVFLFFPWHNDTGITFDIYVSTCFVHTLINSRRRKNICIISLFKHPRPHFLSQ